MSVKYPVIPLPGPEGFLVKYIYIKRPYLLPPSCFSILQLRTDFGHSASWFNFCDV